jgi:hypothetical protein
MNYFSVADFVEVLKEVLSKHGFLPDRRPFYESDLLKKFVDKANEKLKKESLLVYKQSDNSSLWNEWENGVGQERALLIYLNECKHEPEKIRTIVVDLQHGFKDVKTTKTTNIYHKCECGKEVKPTSFMEAK